MASPQMVDARPASQTQTLRSAESTASRIALVGVGVGTVLAIVKIVAGIKGHSVAVVSDGIESAADVVSSAFVWFSLVVAGRPADEDHPYGHGRFETLIALGIGLLLGGVGTGICIGALQPRVEQSPPALFAIWVMIGAVAIKATLAAIKMRVGKKTGSSALTADAVHDNVDILSGVVAIVSLTLALLAPERLHAADHYGAFLIGLIVIFIGIGLIRENALQLMDTMPNAERMDEVRRVALLVPGALGVEKCYARRTGLRYHVDMHLEVDPELTVRASHDIATAVKHRLRSDIDWVEDVLVHVEPHGGS